MRSILQRGNKHHEAEKDLPKMPLTTQGCDVHHIRLACPCGVTINVTAPAWHVERVREVWDRDHAGCAETERAEETTELVKTTG